MAKKKPKLYVVWKGRKEGIFSTWSECQAQIQGYSGAQYKSFSSRSEAEAAFASSYYDHVGGSSGEKKPAKAKVSVTTDAITPSLSVDAACSGNPGIMEFRGVDTETGEQIFHFGPFPDATNNIGEYLALVHALRMLTEDGRELPIYTDSITAMAWVRNRKPKTTLAVTSRNQEVFAMMEEATEWLKQHSPQHTILKWDTVQWGEIPADFGRK